MFYLVVFLILIPLAFATAVFVYAYISLYRKTHKHVRAGKNRLPSTYTPKTKYVTTEDGLRLAYWDLPASNPKGVIILIHGYHDPGGKTLMTPHVEYLQRAGFSVILPDLRAHGESDGKFISFGVHEWKDIVAVATAVKANPEYAHLHVGLFGISMGAATALIAGRKFDVFATVASVPYASIDTLLAWQIRQMHLPAFLILPFAKTAASMIFGPKYRSVNPMASVDPHSPPTLFIRAENDTSVCPSDATNLFEKSGENGELWSVVSGHDVYREHPKDFEQKVTHFFIQHL